MDKQELLTIRDFIPAEYQAKVKEILVQKLTLAYEDGYEAGERSMHEKVMEAIENKEREILKLGLGGVKFCTQSGKLVDAAKALLPPTEVTHD